MRSFDWTAQRLEAADLVFLDRLTNAEIARRLGISRRTLDRWKSHEEFQREMEYRATIVGAEAVNALVAKAIEGVWGRSPR